MIHERLAPAALQRIHGDGAEGAGGLLGRLQEIRALETAAVNGALAGVLALAELVAASVVLVMGGLELLAVALGAWLLIALAAARVHLAHRGAWTASRLAAAERLIERMLGHRAIVVQQPPARWDDGDPAAGREHERRAVRMDKSLAWLTALVPGAWFAGGLIGLTLTASRDGAVALGVAGVVLGTTGLARLAAAASVIAAARAGWGHVAPLLAAHRHHRSPAGQVSASDGDTALVRAHDVVVRNDASSARVLGGVHVAIAPGDRIVVTGESGAGKSTLVSALAGLAEPSSGSVSRRGTVVLVPQFHDNHIFLAPLSFNLLMGRAWPPTPADLAEAEQVCRSLGLGGLLDRMPAGINEIVGETGWQLSNGERSLVQIARALLQRPDVLILDESLGPLDPGTQMTALRCVEEQAEALVLVSHG